MKGELYYAAGALVIRWEAQEREHWVILPEKGAPAALREAPQYLVRLGTLAETGADTAPGVTVQAWKKLFAKNLGSPSHPVWRDVNAAVPAKEIRRVAELDDPQLRAKEFVDLLGRGMLAALAAVGIETPTPRKDT